jgi:hypothetical protein
MVISSDIKAFQVMLLDAEAANDGPSRRQSTFENAHYRLRLFSGRNDPAARDEQYERLYLVLLDANRFQASARVFAVGDSQTELALSGVFDELTKLVAERNPDFYEYQDGNLIRASR